MDHAAEVTVELAVDSGDPVIDLVPVSAVIADNLAGARRSDVLEPPGGLRLLRHDNFD